MPFGTMSTRCILRSLFHTGYLRDGAGTGGLALLLGFADQQSNRGACGGRRRQLDPVTSGQLLGQVLRDPRQQTGAPLEFRGQG